MLALERLSPLERAAFLLHDVFGIGFEEIAETIQRSPAACRQLAARAREHVREARPTFRVDKQRGLEIANAFFAASRNGDMGALGAMLAADVSLFTDGGGKRSAVGRPVLGFDHVMKMCAALAAFLREHRSTLIRTALINGLPGFVTREADGELQTTALEIEDGMVTAIYVVRNPDKLQAPALDPFRIRLSRDSTRQPRGEPVEPRLRVRGPPFDRLRTRMRAWLG